MECDLATDKSRPLRACVVGLGYIGLPTAVSLATGGAEVIGVDVNGGVVERVNRGEAPFEEPDLSVALSGAVAMGRLSAATDLPAADAFVIAVPTPFTAERNPDLSHVTAAAKAISAVLRGGEIIVLESTVPPGTTRRMSEMIAAERPDLRMPHVPASTPDVHIAHCPERVLPGRIMIEIASNDRVIGGLTPGCATRAAELYRTFCHGQLLVTDAESAEMAKLAENAYRDVNIAFANELSLICERLGLDVWEIRQMANHHPRVDILRPGPGVGGHCIAVDPWFIVDAAPDLARLIRTARAVNDGRPAQVASRIVAACRELRQPRIAFLGLSFKPNVADMRESPAISIVAQVAELADDAGILVAEPYAVKLPSPLDEFGNITLTSTERALDDAEIVALLVDHDCFKGISKDLLGGKVVFDTRGLWR
jgi:UDP-N-acetyl-D-mannosaminuronic acid dehydrogenase